MRDYAIETKKRITFIQSCLNESHAEGIVYGNSGGKDSALTGILCKMACDNTIGIIMPCSSRRNYEQDQRDAQEVANAFDISQGYVDLSPVKLKLLESVHHVCKFNDEVLHNIAPRLRMTTLYMIAASEHCLVAGTGNKSEHYMGYFTKWGDGAYDFNPIGDLTVEEIYDFLRYFNAPSAVIEKAPSAGLYENQSDEQEMGICYQSINDYMNEREVTQSEKRIIERYHVNSEHKRHMPKCYGETL